MPRIERDDFRDPTVYHLARRLADAYDPARDGTWAEFVAWATGYDLVAEALACGAEVGLDLDADLATLRGLA